MKRHPKYPDGSFFFTQPTLYVKIDTGGDTMKKYKEFLLLFLPFLVLTVLPIVIFLTVKTDGVVFVGNAQYFKLMMKDPIMKKGLLYTYFSGAIYAVCPIIILALLKIFIKPMKRKLAYFIGLPVSAVAAFLALWLKSIRYVGLPIDFYYDTHSIVATSPPPITASISVDKVFIALQIAFLLMLLYWSVETVVLKIKSR